MDVGRRTAGSDIDGGRRSTGSDIDVGRRSEGGMEFGGFRLQLTPKPVEAAAGRQWYNFAPSRLARSARAVMSSGRNSGSDIGRSSGPDRRSTKEESPSRRSSSPDSSFKLSELAALADDETVLAALHDTDSPRHAGWTSSSTAQPPHCSNMPARAQRTMQMLPVPERAMAEPALDKGTAVIDIFEIELRRKDGERPATAHVIGLPSAACAGRRPGHSAEAKRAGAPAVPPAAAPPASPPAPSCVMRNFAPPATPSPLPANVKVEGVTPQELSPIAPYAGGPTIISGTNPGRKRHSTCMQVHTSHGASMSAQVGQSMQAHAFRRYLPATLARCGIFLQDLSGVGADTRSLHAIFDGLFTPKHPNTLPKDQWLSYTKLFSMVQPYAPGRVWKQGRRNLKQLVIQWCKNQPIFVGLEESDWCMRMKEFDEERRKQRVIFMFCLECKKLDA